MGEGVPPVGGAVKLFGTNTLFGTNVRKWGGEAAPCLGVGGEPPKFFHVPRDLDPAALSTHGHLRHDIPGLEGQELGPFGTERDAPRTVKSARRKRLTPTSDAF